MSADGWEPSPGSFRALQRRAMAFGVRLLRIDPDDAPGGVLAVIGGEGGLQLYPDLAALERGIEYLEQRARTSEAAR